jgi:alkanesulfonate monooxygenase SsuD/methylene tetrahydromethanopterin reductase-like flavin-dependent oxidoreductase (luciferase family)
MTATQFGFGLITCQHHPYDSRTDRDLYRDAIELAVEAESLGFDSVWTSEHHFFDDSYLSAQLPLLGAIAARTERIALGPCVLLAPLYDPIHLAEDAATVDLIAAGRLVLGLGLGWRGEEFDGFGIRLADRVRRMEDTIATLRQAWTDEAVSSEGTVFGFPDVHVTPKPTSAGGPPIWIGALVEPAIRRATRIANGFIATKVSPEQFGQQVRWALDELERTGRDPSGFVFAVHHPVFAWDGADAWQTLEPCLRYMDWKYDDMAVTTLRPRPGGLPPATNSAVDRKLRDECLWGSPERVAEGVAEYCRAGGVDVHFIARSYFPGLDPAIQRETLRLFATQVIPMVHGRAYRGVAVPR